jgi:hypothetical protein
MMEEEIRKLRKEVHEMHETLKKVEDICSRMNNHISFVEATYTTVKTPMDFVLQKISSYMGISSTEYLLPTLSPGMIEEEKNN